MKHIRNILSVLLVCAMMFLSSCTAPQDNTATGIYLNVHFIDVGQGDATLLESGGEYMLIDAGEREYGYDVADYITAQGARRLRYVIATHPHSDHVGGLADVLHEIPCDTFITAETDQTSRTWMRVLSEVEEQDIEYIDAAVGDTYRLGSSTFTILAPSSDDYSGYNNYSVATRFVCGSTSFMLTGDAEKASEYEMLDTGLTLSSDVLKCGHHGSSTSSTAKFLKAVNPKSAVISCGKGNEYGHPHKETLQKLNLLGCDIYRTDEMGTVVAYSNGRTITFSYGGTTVDAGSSTGTAADLPDEINYIGNRNSHVFHNPACGSVDTMKESNKVVFNSREEAIKAGYEPCNNCTP